MMMYSYSFQFLCFILCYSNISVTAVPLIGHNILHAKPNQFPFIVSIGNKKNNLQGNEEQAHFCGGALITRRHVLSSAHCILGTDTYEDLEVTVGSIDLRSGQKYNVEGAVSYTTWARMYCVDYEPGNHDIAIFELSRCVDRSIELASLSKLEYADLYGMTAVTAGWGETDAAPNKPSRFLKTASLRVISEEECAEDISKYVNVSKICTKADPYTIIGCGDSGGPLLINGKEIIGLNDSICPSRKLHPHIPMTSRVSLHEGVAKYHSFIRSMTSDSYFECNIL